MDRQHDAALHVEHSRAGDLAVLDGERPSIQCAEREDRVVVPHDQHLRRRPEPGVHVWTSGALDKLSVMPEPPLDHITNGARRACDRFDVVRRRFDRHQVFEIRQH